MTLANNHLPMWASLVVNTLLLGVFAAVMVKRDFSAVLQRILQRKH